MGISCGWFGYPDVQPNAALSELMIGPMKLAKGPVASEFRIGQTMLRIRAWVSICG